MDCRVEFTGEQLTQNSLQRKNFWFLLQSVSRSFYLSLRYLPNSVRTPLSLAYLLARLTDTFADYNSIPLMFRMDIIKQLKILISAPSDSVLLNEVSQAVKFKLNDFSVADKLLIASIPFLFELLSNQSSNDKLYIQEVLNKIIEGQLLDLHYFDSKQGIVHFSTENELDNYLYLVAGCVGEFWTKLCFSNIPEYAKNNLDYMLLKAVNFGKALQLTNILRDIPTDVRNGRFYLPYKGYRFEENMDKFLNSLLANKELLGHWHNKAIQYLNDAAFYIEAVNNRRVKFACLVPFFIAKDTLNTLRDLSYIRQQQSVKISRKKVYLYIWEALFDSALGNRSYHD